VLIAGPNGSGKTRILNKIMATIKNKPLKNDVEKAKKEIEPKRNRVVFLEQNLNHYKSQTSNEKKQNQINPNIYASTSEIGQLNQQIKRYEELLNWNFIETSELAQQYTVVPFVPKELKLEDCNLFHKNQLLKEAIQINNVGIHSLHRGAFAKIQVVQNRCFNATHQDSHVSEKEKNDAINDYEKLRKLIDLFLNTDITRTLDGDAKLFGFPLGNSNLSDGQKILLQFCMAIYSQETALNDLILVLDEPENHLHPSVIIKLLDKIQRCNSNGQIWIATHSIPLLAHFNPALIWYVENNKIQYAGKIPEKVLQSLLGDDDEIAKLQDFISLPAQYATNQFAFECLIEPSAIMTTSDDPQTHQIRTELLKLSENGKIRVLDYGAGQGRLILGLFDLDVTDRTQLIDKLDYIAFDNCDKNKEQCENTIKRVFNDSNNRYFNDMNKLLSHYNKGSFNVIVMCNVLHEIDPKDWLKLFKIDGQITTLLAENGILLLVEDYQMPIGEKAYQKGFLVLDTPQLKDLFKIAEEDAVSMCSEKENGRLKAHYIPRHCLIQIDEDSRCDCLSSLITTARDKISEIRAKEHNYQNGKLHGFWTQQFANAHLSLAELKT